jgi:alpha-L-fucosidase 2
LITFFLILFSFSNCKQTSLDNGNDQLENVLWYKHPAQNWEEALPLGNGRLGAMVFGNPVTERIQLNDDSLWPIEDSWNKPEGNKKKFEQNTQAFV